MKARGLAMTIAVLLALGATSAIFLYVQGVKNQAKPNTGGVSVIVSKKDIVAGTPLNTLIQEGSLTSISVPKDAVVQGAVTSLSQLQDQSTTAFILQGEQISTARLSGTTQHTGGKLGIPEGMVAVTIALDSPQAVGGDVQSRDHVSVLATFNNISLIRFKSLRAILSGSGNVNSQNVPIGDFTLTVVSDVLVLKVSGQNLICLSYRNGRLKQFCGEAESTKRWT